MKKSLLLLSAFAFNNGTWKLDENGAVVLKDGNPVYVDGSGREMVAGIDTILKFSGEAKTYREAKEALENKLKAFEGIDPEKARKSIEIADKIDAKQLIDAGKVDELKNQITAQFTTQLQEKDKANGVLEQNYNNLLVNNLFSQSEFVRNNLAVPRDMFEATFRNNFKVENGQVVAYDKAGNRLLSATRTGEFADPEEALQLLVSAHPQKDVILKADIGNGSGNNGGGGGGGGATRVIKRADFAKLDATKQAETAAKIGKGEMQLTD